MISVAVLYLAFIAGCVIQSIATSIRGSGISVGSSSMVITVMSIPGVGSSEVTMGLTFQHAGLIANEGAKVSPQFSAVKFIVGPFGGLLLILSAENSTRRSALIEL